MNPIDRIEFGYRLRTLRESAEGHTQEYCAAVVRVTRRQWINWERGRCYPSGHNMRNLLRLYPTLVM